MGRRVCVALEHVCTAQKSHLKWHPRPGLDQSDRQVAFAAEDGAVGAQPGERGRSGFLAVALSRSRPCRASSSTSGQSELRLAAHDASACRATSSGRAWRESRPSPRAPAAAVLGGDLVGAFGRVGLDADGDEIGGFVERVSAPSGRRRTARRRPAASVPASVAAGRGSICQVRMYVWPRRRPMQG
jgi:hypothetical protein